MVCQGIRTELEAESSKQMKSTVLEPQRTEFSQWHDLVWKQELETLVSREELSPPNTFISPCDTLS